MPSETPPGGLEPALPCHLRGREQWHTGSKVGEHLQIASRLANLTASDAAGVGSRVLEVNEVACDASAPAIFRLDEPFTGLVTHRLDQFALPDFQLAVICGPSGSGA